MFKPTKTTSNHGCTSVAAVSQRPLALDAIVTNVPRNNNAVITVVPGRCSAAPSKQQAVRATPNQGSKPKRRNKSTMLNLSIVIISCALLYSAFAIFAASATGVRNCRQGCTAFNSPDQRVADHGYAYFAPSRLWGERNHSLKRSKSNVCIKEPIDDETNAKQSTNKKCKRSETVLLLYCSLVHDDSKSFRLKYPRVFTWPAVLVGSYKRSPLEISDTAQTLLESVNYSSRQDVPQTLNPSLVPCSAKACQSATQSIPAHQHFSTNLQHGQQSINK